MNVDVERDERREAIVPMIGAKGAFFNWALALHFQCSLLPHGAQTNLVFGMGTVVDDTVHIQVEIIEFDAIGIGLGQIWLDDLSIDLLRQVLKCVHHCLTILLC